MVKPSDGIRKKSESGAEKIPSPISSRPVKSDEKSFEHTLSSLASKKKEDAIPPLLKKFVKEENKSAEDLRTEDEFVIIEPGGLVGPASSADHSVMLDESKGGPPSKVWQRAGGMLRGKTPDVRGVFSRAPKMWLGVITGLTAIIILTVLLSTVFARITLEILPKVESVEIGDVAFLFDVSAHEVLIDERVIPVEHLEFNRVFSDEFEATGREVIEEKAKGGARIYNQFSSSPQGLVQNTRFMTSDGLIYRLTKGITVPGAKIEEGKIVPQYIEVELVADKAGETHNRSGEITMKIPGFEGGPKYEGFYALAPSGFGGGFKGEARVVSREDLTRAEEISTKNVFDELKREMARKIPPELELVDALSEIEIVKIDAPREKTRRDKFSVEASARGRIFVFKEKDVFDVLKKLILIGGNEKELMEETANLEYKVGSLDFDKGHARVLLGGRIKTAAKIAEDDIAELVRGKKAGTINEILKGRSEIASFEISLFPPWIFKAPDSSGKIRFKIIID